MNYGMIHFGEYEGRTVEDVIELDPAWIIENAKEHQIHRDAVYCARKALDRYDEEAESYPDPYDN